VLKSSKDMFDALILREVRIWFWN